MKVILRTMALLTIALALPITSAAQNPQDDAMNRAIAQLQLGHMDIAIAAATEAIMKRPDYVDAYLLRAKLRMMTRDTYRAMADINKVIQLNPDMGQAYAERATIRLLARDIEGAIQDLDSAIVRNYKVDHVYTLRAQLRWRRGDMKGALADLDESIRLNPNNPLAYASRAGLLLAMEDRDRALIDLDYLLTWYETDPTKRLVQGAANNNEKQDSPTVGDRTTTLGIAMQTTNAAPGDKDMVPVIAGAYVNRGLINSFRGNVDAAISDLTKSIRLDSTNPWAFHYRAFELETKGDLAAALADVSRAIQIDPMNGNLRVEHGVILVLMGNSKEAQLDFDMLLNSDRTLWQKRIDERLAAVKQKVRPSGN